MCVLNVLHHSMHKLSVFKSKLMSNWFQQLSRPHSKLNYFSEIYQIVKTKLKWKQRFVNKMQEVQRNFWKKDVYCKVTVSEIICWYS